MGREKTKFLGVYKRESTERRHAGKPDICYDITFKDATGRKIWEKIGWTSEGYSAATAAEKRSTRMQEIRDGVALPKRKRVMLLSQGYKEFKAKELTTDSKWTKTTKAMWDQHILPRLGNKPMTAITALDIESFRDDLLTSGRSAQTVRHILGSLRHVYKTLQRWGIYKAMIPPIEMPEVDGTRLKYLTHAEAHLLMECLRKRSVKWWRIALVSLHTGMRIGEVLALRAGDVDLQCGIITVKDGKTGTRPAYLTETAAKELAGIIPKERGALIFPSRKGGISKESSDSFIRAVNDAKLNEGVTDARDKVVFHTLRHTFGSWAIQRGMAIEMLAKLMGHSTLELTRRYAKHAPDQMRASVSVIEETWARPFPTHGLSPDVPQ